MNNTASAKRRTAAILASALFGVSAVLCQAAPTLKEIQSQLQSHVRISMNVGITAPQLQQLVPLLQARVSADNATRMRTVLQQTLDPSPSH
jgi:alkylhydroperoxidase/carboxymuconolactone decarboxylase family protein YurZ